MKIAFVHEYLNQFGGAERVLQVLSSMYPDAPIYTLLYDPEATGKVFEGKEIRTSFLQRMPLAKRYHRFFPLLMPFAIEQFDFSGYDIVVSISASFSKGIITKSGTKHVCYCLTPPRFLWDGSHRFMDQSSYPFLIKRLLPPFISYLRIWDIEAALRVDKFIAISHFVKERISKYYGEDVPVVYSPVNTSKFFVSSPEKIKSYFLAVGRLVPYKKFDLLTEAFNRLQMPLIIVGTGPELRRLKKMAKENIVFKENASDDELATLYSEANAFIFPQEEDFGLTPLEAMASGTPVIAFGKGGARETIVEGKTGVFFSEQTAESLEDVVRNFDRNRYKSQDCRARAEEFSIEKFRKDMTEIIETIA
jgi:glycosyltransferase involved in cell wall biosynthesis